MFAPDIMLWNFNLTVNTRTADYDGMIHRQNTRTFNYILILYLVKDSFPGYSQDARALLKWFDFSESDFF